MEDWQEQVVSIIMYHYKKYLDPLNGKIYGGKILAGALSD
jgi:hypothetical protein